MPSAIAFLIATAALACGARSHAEGDDDIADWPDGDADADADAGGEDEGGGGEGELDLGPDARPSDDPEADDWEDTDPSSIEVHPAAISSAIGPGT